VGLDVVSASKVLWGPMLVILVIVLGTTWAATQWAAWRLGFQPQLDSPWIHIGHLPVYAPPAFFLWWYWFDAYAPRVFSEGAVIVGWGGRCHVDLEGSRRQAGYDPRFGALGQI
jgi:type IV secretion system protein VirD4